MTLSLPLARLRRRAPRRVVRTVAYLLPLAYYLDLLVLCVRPAAAWWALAGAAATLAAGLLLVPRDQRSPVPRGGLLDRQTIRVLLLVATLGLLLAPAVTPLAVLALILLHLADPLYGRRRTRAVRASLAAAGLGALSRDDDAAADAAPRGEVASSPQVPLDSAHPGPFPDSLYDAGVPGARPPGDRPTDAASPGHPTA